MTVYDQGTNDVVAIAEGMPQKTMFKQLLDMGLDYKVYYQDVPAVLQFKDMRHKEARERYAKYEALFTDLESGDIPEFTWIEPGMCTLRSLALLLFCFVCFVFCFF